MRITARFYAAALTLVVSGALIACSGGSGSTPPISSPNASQQQKAPARHTYNLANSQAQLTGFMLLPLSVSVSGTTGSVSLAGTAACGLPVIGNPNPCPGVSFPTWTSPTDVNLTFTATTLSAACANPSTTATPAPGFAPACYIVAYEGGVGPYVISGPATNSGGNLSFPALNAPASFYANTGYNFFLAYATYVSATPPPATPTPVPAPTSFNTPIPPPPPTPTPKPTPTVSRQQYERNQ